MSAPKRIIVTGGSGLAGTHITKYLLERNHQILNLDITPLNNTSVHTIITDLTDQAQVLSALSTPQFSLPEYRSTDPLVGSKSSVTADAIIHLAAFPRPLLVPDHKLFTTNVTATFNVIDAASRLGIKKIILASTQSVYGAAYGAGSGACDWHEVPVLEDTYDANPEDVYGMSKLVAERIARTYARRFGADVYCLRIGHVLAPGMYAELVPQFLADDEMNRRIGWSYTDSRDLGQMCERALAVHGLGWQVFNAVNDGVMAPQGVSTAELLGRVAPGVRVMRELGKREAPTSNEKIKRLLGFREEFNWETELEKEKNGRI